jgi:hypothetical protein
MWKSFSFASLARNYSVENLCPPFFLSEKYSAQENFDFLNSVSMLTILLFTVPFRFRVTFWKENKK